MSAIAPRDSNSEGPAESGEAAARAESDVPLRTSWSRRFARWRSAAEGPSAAAKATVRGFVRGAKEAMHSAWDGTTGTVRAMVRYLKRVKDQTQEVIAGLSGAEAEVGEPHRLVARLVAVLPKLVSQLDGRAQGFSVGHLRELGAGLGDAEGIELLYIRRAEGRPARLRVSRTGGLTARLSIGYTKRAYGRSFYGDADAIAAAVTRQGLELGYLAAVQLFSARAPEDPRTVFGFTVSLGVALGPGVPVVQESSLFRLTEQPLASVVLTSEQEATIEATLASAPDRAVLRAMATGRRRPTTSLPPLSLGG